MGNIPRGATLQVVPMKQWGRTIHRGPNKVQFNVAFFGDILEKVHCATLADLRAPLSPFPPCNTMKYPKDRWLTGGTVQTMGYNNALGAEQGPWKVLKHRAYLLT
jgi:hypothetical protein